MSGLFSLLGTCLIIWGNLFPLGEPISRWDECCSVNVCEFVRIRLALQMSSLLVSSGVVLGTFYSSMRNASG